LEQVVRTSGARVALGKVNIDRERELAAKWRVSAIPDVRVFRDGRQVEAFVGVRGEAELRALVQRELAQLPPPAGAAGAASGTNPEAPAAPPIQRMEKDWLPKGIERR
jgi:thioredoxin-like negative regulator of GroEL